ncbi:MAG: germination protein YpeB [Ruminococcus sp.]|nr:germination protein YpeB [Ruminococcus sp.]
MKLTKRGLIRAAALSISAVVVLLVRNCMLMSESKNQQIIIKNNYIYALEELSSAADNINNTLEKQLYASTAEQQAALANKLFTEASAAKVAISQLPIGELSLQNTYKFLSQVGNYAQSTAEKTEKDVEISDEEYNNLKSLCKYAENLSNEIWEIEESIASGEIDIMNISNNYNKDEDSPTITEGFTEFEEGFESYPTLIYDGPFSDHIMEKEPLMTKNAEEVTEMKALERASMILNISSNDLSEVIEREGTMPCYIFSDESGSVSCGVTKQGGYVSYFLKSRQPQNAIFEIKECVQKAEEFIDDAGYNNMKVTYYERTDNTVVVNFAYCIDKITCYTDLMKVTVAMDDGEILGFEANGYLVNHQKRNFPDQTLSILDCQEIISPYLECESRGKAIIPTDGANEICCYEFKCKAENGREVLVYINAETGDEEEILILLENENGTLTM